MKYLPLTVVLIVLAIIASISLFAVVRPTEAHEWYDGECCSEFDCRQTTLGEVERHDDGWYIAPLNVTLPFDDERVRRSLDPLIHICLVPSGAGKPTLRCLYVPEVAG